MKNKMKNEDIALLTFKNLMMVLKNKKLYPLFRCTVGVHARKAISYSNWAHLNDECWYRMQRMMDSKRSSFTNVDNYKQIVEVMTEMCHVDGEFPKENSKIQMLITQHINNLLHCSLEGIIGDFMTLETIGKETFDATCKAIFGNDFVDETEKEIPDEARRFIEAQREFMMSDKGRGIRFGDLGNHKAFLEFMKRKRFMPNEIENGLTIDNSLLEAALNQEPPTYLRQIWDDEEYSWQIFNNNDLPW